MEQFLTEFECQYGVCNSQYTSYILEQLEFLESTFRTLISLRVLSQHFPGNAITELLSDLLASSFQSYNAPSYTSSFQSSDSALMTSSSTLTSSSNSCMSSIQSNTPLSTNQFPSSIASPPPLPPPIVVPTSSSTASMSCVAPTTRCNSSTGI